MARNYILRGTVCASAILMLTLPATLVSAQTANQPAAAQPGGIEQVVVTATRRSELLNKVPVSISAFTKERIDQLERQIGRRSGGLHAGRELR